MECNASLQLENLCRVPCQEKPPSEEGGETRKQRPREHVLLHLWVLVPPRAYFIYEIYVAY